MIKIFAFIFMGLVCIASDRDKSCSASVPHSKLVVGTTPWSYCYTGILVDGKQVRCLTCGASPMVIRISDGKVEAYCQEHRQ